MGDDWEVGLEHFRAFGGDTAASLAYIALVESARLRWQETVHLHPWRLDALVFLVRRGSKHQVWGEYRVRDSVPVMVFKLGPAGSMDAEPVVTGDICRLATAPVVLDSLLLQIAEPGGSGDTSGQQRRV